MSIQEDMFVVLSSLCNKPRSERGEEYIQNSELQELTDLPPERLNDAVALLVDNGYLEWLRTMGMAPYNFRDVMLTAHGRYEYERVISAESQKETQESQNKTQQFITQPPVPVGSPFGFTDLDWEIVSEAKSETDKLNVVFGYAFESENYETELLSNNIESLFDSAVKDFNKKPGIIKISLNFQNLAAGYGEHLFNEIVRDIIASDIAVFETSDLNPNVMLEMGVALTWGVRVLPIKEEKCSEPPSDISGQTWANYQNNGGVFLDPDNANKIVRMIERAMRKKVSR